MSALPPLLLLDRYDDTDPVLEPEIAQQIRMQLPRKLRNATKWNLVYSSDQHGISMTTLFHRCRGKGPMVMAIKDSTGCVFGAFITEELKPNLSYYGTGEWYVDLKRKQKVVQFWKWTGKNDYMVLSEPGFIGLGGGDGKFGLWLHSDLEMGHSAKCATFDNEPLAAACRHPIIIGPNGEQQRAPTLIKPSVAADRPYSRSSSPKNDKEEFYCQTVEIWAMAL
ncbi:TLD-domain-containing protein [Lobosporangium transversale]|uniref:Oxidation resistance protein 1 n=1 Tax=Lobosporangium transversale TaxID=64571 RepID=A0A1Y2GA79_9FUNG|nr:TLD-domain-containing protein [Lobosporangium transversale]ORZ04180.1 TLD-domain-containing protein [Lobosporangium transversale]|eukprot:XP_021876394.1 TLD-domain-containing protein [Lobosporangium transversale]